MRPSRLILVTVVTATFACQTPDPEGAKKDAPVVAPAKTPDVKTPETPGATAGTPTGATAGAATAGAATAGAAATAGEAPATAGQVTAGPGDIAVPGDTAEPTGGPPPETTPPPTGDKTKLLGEAKAKKTSDARAKKALEEAEAAGATPRELATASNERGVALLGAGEAERATAAFEWARDKDTTYPDPSFNLAKQTVLAGDIPATVAHLKEVHKRGGKTLLKQVGFDPTFEIVKDDPEIAKIVK